ncbi:MAG: cellulose synthase subunit BcsC-related outer membrane protein [Pseudomonadota bacterium]
MTPKPLIGLLTLLLLGTSVPLLAQSEASRTPAQQALLAQAEFWIENQRPDLARQVMKRYLDGQPNDTEVIYRLAALALEQGDSDEAARLSARLERLNADDERVASLALSRMGRQIPAAELEQVRSLARQGRAEQAVAGYRALFDGNVPPPNLAVEYYQTLAGTDQGWEEARQQLERLHQNQPGNRSLARALAETLTYREGTRREGIERLAELHEQGLDVQTPWRQALEWLDATPADEARYARFASATGDDAMLATFEERMVQGSRSAGYQALNQGRLSEAEQAFARARQENPEDADAIAGQGLAALRRQRFAEARQLLGQAMELAPERRAEWLGAYRSANFYARLGQARAQGEAGELERALATVRPLTQEGGEAGLSARLLEADLLRRLGRLGAAEQAYLGVLDDIPNSVDARLGMIQVLREQQRWDEATAMAESLPAPAQENLGDISLGRAQALREQAAQQSLTEAEATLRQAITIAPQDPWVRLDLARLMHQQGRSSEAEWLMSPLLGPDASVEQRHAAALLAAEQGRWNQAQRLVATIPAEQREEDLTNLLQRSRQQEHLEELAGMLETGNPAASTRLQQLYQDSEVDAAIAGEIALMLSDAGMPEQALSWARRDLRGGTPDSPGRFTAHLLVLARHGHLAEAQGILHAWQAIADLPLAERRQLDELARGIAVISADRLRQQGQLASAYDVLAPPLRQHPDDEALLLAMGRLYAQGDKPTQAAEVFDYALRRHPQSDEALAGALRAALASGQLPRARQLLARHAKRLNASPALLMTAADVARQSGDNREALRYLQAARRALPRQPLAGSAEPQNPFRNSAASSGSGGDVARPGWLPGMAGGSPGSFDAGEAAPRLETRIDTMIAEIQRERAPRFDGDVTLALRNGDPGLSQLDTLSMPLEISWVPLDDARLSLQITPVRLDAGSADTASLRQRLGRSTLPEGARRLDSSLSDITPILDQIEQTGSAFFQAEQRANLALDDPNLPAAEQQRLVGEAEAARELFDAALARNPLFESGFELVSLTEQQRSILQRFLGDEVDLAALSQASQLDGDSAAALDASRERLEEQVALLRGRLQAVGSAADPEHQQATGSGIALGYAGENVSLDVGSTPLGFERTNLVGGIEWHPALSDTTRLSLKAEQRAVTDSLLSYAGTHDAFTGDTWGGVVKTGGSLGIRHDSDDGGLYADVGAYRYTGHNVADNSSVELSAGGYVRPINTDRHQLQTGIHLGLMAYDEDLSHFTYGHGGYFSPQEYISVSFPLRYQAEQGKLSYEAHLTPGYQAYSTDGNAVFPTDPDAQALADTLTQLGGLAESRYPASDESGLGLSVGGEVAYRLNSALSVGGGLNYNSFGDYEDTSANLTLRYHLGGTQ